MQWKPASLCRKVIEISPRLGCSLSQGIVLRHVLLLSGRQIRFGTHPLMSRLWSASLKPIIHSQYLIFTQSWCRVMTKTGSTLLEKSAALAHHLPVNTW